MFFDGDSIKVVADGNVTVTYGYELKNNGIGAYTSFLFSAKDSDDAEGPARAMFAGVCISSPLKALPVVMNARMYLLDEGTPVNFNACYSEARSKAAALLEVPRSSTGYVYEVDGFRNYWLDAGVSSVQHSWEGNSPAYTFLAVNAPGASLPAGPPAMRKRDVASVDARLMIDRQIGD
jgi:hypothetical protein